MILSSHVDKKVCDFSEWKRGLEQEDVREVGCVVKRPLKDLRLLYVTYRKFQTSVAVCEKRKELYG